MFLVSQFILETRRERALAAEESHASPFLTTVLLLDIVIPDSAGELHSDQGFVVGETDTMLAIDHLRMQSDNFAAQRLVFGLPLSPPESLSNHSRQYFLGRITLVVIIRST